MSLDSELTAAEQRFFDSGGADTAGVLAEHGRSAEPEPQGDGGLSAAEEHYFRSGGDVTDDLRREYGPPPAEQPQSDFKFRPELQGFIDRAVAAARGDLQAERISHARTQARFDLLREVVAPPPAPASEPAPAERPDPEQDIFAAYRDLNERFENQEKRIERYEQQATTTQREMAAEATYRASLDAAVRQEPAVYDAYNHLLRSRAAELMASRYPQATPEQLMQAEVPPDIRQALQAEERDLYKSAFAAGRHPAIDIVKLAQMRGWQSPYQVEAAKAAQAEAQRRQRETEATAKAKAEDEAWTARAAFARHKHYWDEDTTFKYNTSARSKPHRDWFYNHEPGPAPYLPSDFK